LTALSLPPLTTRQTSAGRLDGRPPRRLRERAATFERANRIGAQATALKQQFLRAYARQRQTATGRNPASLPNIF
jgi:hypothetical protein